MSKRKVGNAELVALKRERNEKFMLLKDLNKTESENSLRKKDSEIQADGTAPV